MLKMILKTTTKQLDLTGLFRILFPMLTRIHYPPETYCLTQESYPLLLHTRPTKLIQNMEGKK